MKGNVMIAPGIERMDTVKTANGYEMKDIWSRNDLSDTSILKLSPPQRAISTAMCRM